MKALTSRTIWTLVFLFVFNGFAAIQADLPAQLVLIVNGVLSMAAAYFRLNPSK